MVKRYRSLCTVMLVILGGTATLGISRPAGAQQRGTSDLYTRCAHACAACNVTCVRCARHCAGMVASGMKEHTKSLHLSQDCADLCGAAARICARRGPMARAACQACVQSCKACGMECGKYPQMKPMRDCARACAACATVCQRMVDSIKGE
jgi:hypothetical protein